MKRLWHPLRSALPPGARPLLGLVAGFYLVKALGRTLERDALWMWLPLSGPEFWGGQLWRIVTQGLLAASLAELVFGGLAILFLGSALARSWTPREFWIYCLVAVAGAGLTAAALRPLVPNPTYGLGALTAGLFVGWSYVRRRESFSLGAFGTFTVGRAAWCMGGAGFMLLGLSAGWTQAIIACSGGLAGLFYLWLRDRRFMARESQTVHSQRISRLEL